MWLLEPFFVHRRKHVLLVIPLTVVFDLVGLILIKVKINYSKASIFPELTLVFVGP